MESIPFPLVIFFLLIGISSAIALTTGIINRKKKGQSFDLFSSSLYIRIAAAAAFGLIFGIWALLARCQ
jgi:hypothetical protein